MFCKSQIYSATLLRFETESNFFTYNFNKGILHPDNADVSVYRKFAVPAPSYA